MSGEALSLQLTLARLRRKHRQPHPAPHVIPLSPPLDQPQVMTGRASTIDIDLMRCRFAPRAFTWPATVPLHYKHDCSRIVGRVEDLGYNGRGDLVVRATVHDPLARRGRAFSVGAKVHDYVIRNPDTPAFFAEIISAAVDEITITDAPANPFALVTDKHDVPPSIAAYDLAILHARRAQVLLQQHEERVTLSLTEAVRTKLWNYLSDDVAAYVGVSLGQLRLYLSNGVGLTDEQIARLARRIHVGT